ncbi:unnamed protein product, partial [Rotaria magnacalcarata]
MTSLLKESGNGGTPLPLLPTGEQQIA